MRKIFFCLSLVFAVLLSAEAGWRYVEDPGKWNNSADKSYSGYVTDGTTWSIFVLNLGNGTWQLGAGQATGINYGIDSGTGGSCQAGTTKMSIGIGSGALDVRAIAADTGMTFSKIGPRCFLNHNAITAITIPDTVVEISNRAFYNTPIQTISFENGCPNLATIGSETFRSMKKCAELDLGDTIVTSILGQTFDASSGFQRVVFPETLKTLEEHALGWITDGDLVIHFKGSMPTTIEANAIRPSSFSDSRKWALKVDVNSKGTWPIRTDIAFADAQAKLPSVTGEEFAEEDYLGYVYPADLGSNGNGTSMKIWVFKEGTAAAVIPATMSVASVAGRTSATLVATVDLGTSASATVSATVDGVTKTATATQNGAVSLEFDGLSLGTTYEWTATVQGTDDTAAAPYSGSFTTIRPDVSLGATDYFQPIDGLSATLTVNVSELLSGTVDVVLSRGGTDIEKKTVSAAGDVSFDVSGLTLGTEYTYTFTATSSENADVATATVTFTARAYYWVYTPNGGETQAYPWDGTVPLPGTQRNFNGYPYHGTLSDGFWTFYVYHDSADADGEFWLGEGGYGSKAFSVAGRPALDLTKVYADTGIKLVRIGGYAFVNQDASVLKSIVMPKYVRHIGVQAFYKATGLTEIDLSHTVITNMEQMAFQNCTSMTNMVLPATLQKLGGTAFAWGPQNVQRVIHFLGDVPEVSPSESSGNSGTDQSLYIGYAGKQQAYCVDAVKYPRWKTDASTTLYDDSDNPFPVGEASWVPTAVRAGRTYANGKKTYGNPFGNSTLGRSYDTSTNGRAYLIQETQIEPGFAIIIR